MKTSAILLALLTALPVFAGRIITYTAVSDKSQEEANNAAMAGVAKQIVVQVNSNQTLTKKEAKSKGNSTLDETFFSSNNVKSNLKLGICGEHGGDPASIEFCHKTGLDYVSCSPFRVPIARLAAAQAVVKEQMNVKNDK